MREIKSEIMKKIVSDLKEGILKSLLDLLQKDDTLDMEIREDYINIYYRGGNIVKISLCNGGYRTYFNKQYLNCESKIDNNKIDENNEEIIIVDEKNKCEKLVETIPMRKKYMNEWLKNNPKQEREIQQLITKENNDNLNGNFYVANIEIADSDTNSRFDMIMLEKIDRTNHSQLNFYIAELKYGENAISGKSGILEHYKQVLKLTNDQVKIIRKNSLEIFKYKNELNLIKLEKYDNDSISLNEGSNEKLNLIYFIAGFGRRYNKNLIKELRKILEDQNIEDKNTSVNVKIFCPYLAGYLMFSDELLSIEDFIDYSNLFIEGRFKCLK